MESNGTDVAVRGSLGTYIFEYEPYRCGDGGTYSVIRPLTFMQCNYRPPCVPRILSADPSEHEPMKPGSDRGSATAVWTDYGEARQGAEFNQHMHQRVTVFA